MMCAVSFQVEFQPTGKRVRASAGENLLESARDSGIELSAACGGEGNCGQCQIIILSGEVSPSTPDEEFIIPELDLQNGRRLACCTRPLSDLKVEIPRESLMPGPRLQIESDLREIDPDPLVRAAQLALEPPTLTDLRSDYTRLVDALGNSEMHASVNVVRIIPEILRENDWRVTAFLRGDEIVGLAPADTRPLGFAVDLGTTKIAAYLVDLENGEELASVGTPNPQIGYGEDVISRLNFVYRNPNGGAIMAEKVHATLDEVLGDLVAQAGVRREQVVEACIVGNTAMTHLLLRLPVAQLAKAPYVAAISEALDVSTEELGLVMASGATVHIPPCIGGFVGADHIAMILGCDLDQTPKVSIGVDIGTNTEIALRIPGIEFMTSVSCASGPAFEGAHITEGMRAASGAIEKIRITPKSIELTTIGDEPPVGLCGSGIIDLVAELHRAGLINDRGRLQKQTDAVHVGENGAEFQLVSAQDSGNGRAIQIGQEDINQIQLAKGAIHAGLEILLAVSEIDPEDVEEVIIAGAFGSFLNVENAIAMGLFPELPNAVYRQVGNAAAIGAKWILISKEARLRARQIQRQTRYHELTTYPRFNRVFAMGMLFPERND
jgi:uncharacterized 2Fe-2S/4Fe-4S cluster protein (DUF4445 family)